MGDERHIDPAKLDEPAGAKPSGEDRTLDARPYEPPKRPRTWRPKALWTAGILLALGLFWFAAAVVLPAWEVRCVVRQPLGLTPGSCKAALHQLGGPMAAVPKLIMYLRLPASVAPNRHVAAYLLCQSGDIATPVIAEVMTTLACDADRWVRIQATLWLASLHDRRAVQPLLVLLRDSDRDHRKVAAEALGSIGDTSAVGALEAALKDEDSDVRSAAAEALQKIRGEEPPE